MSTIKSSAENLTLNADGANNDIKFQSNGSEVASIDQAGLVTATSFAGSGANLTGISSVGGATGVDFNDNVKARFGTGNDLEIFHDGSNSYISDTGATGLIIKNDALQLARGGNAEKYLEATANGSVDLYHNNNKKIETTATGTTTTGVEYISRDVSNYATDAATAISTATLKLKTHAGDSTLTSFGGMSGGTTYIQRTNASGSATYPIALNPYGGKVNIGDGTPHFSDSLLRIMQSNSYPFIELNMTGTGSMGAVKYENGNGTVGSISMYSNSVSFNTSSDYRLKENVDYTWDATTRLKQLKPARFNFISDDTNTLVDGFIAHEVSSVVPEAIFGTKDAMTAEVLYVEGDELPEGKSVGDVKEASVIDPQGIDQGKLVPLLVKTVQELEARITALEG